MRRITNADIIELSFTRAEQHLIRERAKHRKETDNTATPGERPETGPGGELLLHKYWPWLLHQSTPDFDFVAPTSYTIDSKAKVGTVRPRVLPLSAPKKKQYHCTVPCYQRVQQCDYYVFSRIHENLRCGWLLGWMPKAEFWSVGYLRDKGEPFNNAERDTVIPTWVVHTGHLYPLQLLSPLLQGVVRCA